MEENRDSKDSVQEILKQILAEDINLLNSRDTLYNQLEEKVPSRYKRELSAVQKALQNNIGELFLKAKLENTESSKVEAKSKTIDILRQNNIQERTIQKVVAIFAYALEWYELIEEVEDEEIEAINTINSKQLNLEDVVFSIKCLNENLAKHEKDLSDIKSYLNNINGELSKQKKEIEAIKSYLITTDEKYKTKQSLFQNSIQDISAKLSQHEKNLNGIKNYIKKLNVQNQMYDSQAINIEKTDIGKWEKLANLWKGFVKDYNSFASKNMSPYEERIAYKYFFKNYNIKRFLYAGDKARCWGFNFQSEMYAVVPKINIVYDYQLHETEKMKEVFSSDYKSGSYTSIRIIKPAIFEYVNDNWNLLEQGEIEFIK